MFAKSKLVSAFAAALLVGGGLGAQSAAGDPTCAGVGALAVHGQHIIGDYVTGIGGINGNLAWPPKGGVVGTATSANGGPVVRGGPGPGFHFPNGVPPGASFCVPQAQSGNALP